VSLADSSTNALLVQGVSRHFNGLVAVEDVSLTIAKGERRAILGANGAGKTTLFNLIAGDIPVSQGRIEFHGEDITNQSVANRVALGLRRTYQMARIFPQLTVLENLVIAIIGVSKQHFGLGLIGQNDVRRQQAMVLAERIGIEAFTELKAETLSHGQRRQLELAMALAGEPKILLFDEPAAGLSPLERIKLTEVIKSLSRDITLVMIEHDMEIALGVCDQVSVLNCGSLIAEGSPEQISQNQMVHDIYLGRKQRDDA
jgi:branched-chain amino acid transport system ATP-binding protein